MKTLIVIAAALMLSGCATLFGGSSASDEFDPNDPIASAAARIRDGQPSGWEGVDAVTAEEHEYQLHRAMTRREITTGMGMGEVRQIWGEPRDVETAGDNTQGNQKWIYYEGLSSKWSVSSTRVVYFESGKVVGWERP